MTFWLTPWSLICLALSGDESAPSAFDVAFSIARHVLTPGNRMQSSVPPLVHAISWLLMYRSPVDSAARPSGNRGWLVSLENAFMHACMHACAVPVTALLVKIRFPRPTVGFPNGRQGVRVPTENGNTCDARVRRPRLDFVFRGMFVCANVVFYSLCVFVGS